MNILIKEFTASDTIDQLTEKLNFNFDQVLLAGGGPKGPTGDTGEQGEIGLQGTRGSYWFIENAIDLNVIQDGDYILGSGTGQIVGSSVGQIYKREENGWLNTNINIKGQKGDTGALNSNSIDFAYYNITGSLNNFKQIGTNIIINDDTEKFSYLNKSNINSLYIGDIIVGQNIKNYFQGDTPRLTLIQNDLNNFSKNNLVLGYKNGSIENDANNFLYIGFESDGTNILNKIENKNLSIDIKSGKNISLEAGQTDLINLKSNILGEKNLTIDGITLLKNTLTVNENTELNGTLEVVLDTNLKKNLTVNENTELNGTLEVTLDTLLKNKLTVNEDTKLNKTLEVVSTSIFRNDIDIRKNINFSGLYLPGSESVNRFIGYPKLVNSNGYLKSKSISKSGNTYILKDDVYTGLRLIYNGVSKVNNINEGGTKWIQDGILNNLDYGDPNVLFKPFDWSFRNYDRILYIWGSAPGNIDGIHNIEACFNNYLGKPGSILVMRSQGIYSGITITVPANIGVFLSVYMQAPQAWEWAINVYEQRLGFVNTNSSDYATDINNSVYDIPSNPTISNIGDNGVTS